MDTRFRSTPARSYEDFQPNSDWYREDGSDTLIIDLPGFVKEQLKVQLDNAGNVNVSGERPIDGNKSRRFYKKFRIPENCNVNQIQARFENETLYVVLPKTITPYYTPETTPARETPATQKTDKIPKPFKEKPTSSAASDHTQKTANSTAGKDGERAPTTQMIGETPKPVKDGDRAPASQKIGETPKSVKDGERSPANQKLGETPKPVKDGERAPATQKISETPTAAADDTYKTTTSNTKTTTSTTKGGGKYMNGMNEKEEEQWLMDQKKERGNYDGDSRKKVDGLKESRDGYTGEGMHESYMHGGGGMMLGMNHSRQLIVNVIVGFMVVIGLSVYLGYKLASPKKAAN